jgi:hypothetical protein
MFNSIETKAGQDYVIASLPCELSIIEEKENNYLF